MQQLLDPETNPGPLYATVKDPKSIQTDPNSLHDNFTYYRIPQLALKIDKRKGFINCLNLEDVSDRLNVPSSILLAYLAFKLKARSKLQDFQLRLRGEQSLILQNVSNTLVLFIVQWILCDKCGLPELHHVWGKSLAECDACGWKDALSKDPKFSSYLAKHFADADTTRLGLHLFFLQHRKFNVPNKGEKSFSRSKLLNRQVEPEKARISTSM